MICDYVRAWCLCFIVLYIGFYCCYSFILLFSVGCFILGVNVVDF